MVDYVRMKTMRANLMMKNEGEEEVVLYNV